MKVSARLAAALLAIALAVLIAAPLGLKAHGLYLLNMWAVMTIAAIGLNLTLGYAGQISLAQAAFVGIGAYCTAILATKYGWPFGATLGVSAVVCFAVGWLLGYPALRVQHHYLAFVTLAFSTLVYLVFRNEEKITGGTYGISGIARPSFFGWSQGSLSFYYLCLLVLAVVAWLAWRLVRSPWGRAFMALRENPLRASSLGVDTRRYTLLAFAIGSALGGIAGSLYAPLVEYIDPTPFTLGLSFNLLLMVIVGGSGYFFGPFIGAVVSVLLPEWLRVTDSMYLISYSIAVMVLMAFCPSGLLGLAERLLAPARREAAAPAKAEEAAS
ncbi:MAG TPA: branched-chain amino acid ABC transporter permease [Burkholderiales bacterium]